MRWHGDHVITTKLLRVMADDFKIESGLTFPHLQDHLQYLMVCVWISFV